MPKIVDRAARRREITDAYLRVVARDGGLAASSRAIAAEVGMAAGALWHYFDDFDQVVRGAFEQIFLNTEERIDRVTAGMRGLQALEAAIREMLPLNALTQEEAVVVVTFWGRVASVPSLGSIQTGIEHGWRMLLERNLREAIADGEIRPDAPVADIVDTLLALVAAQQVEYVVSTSIGSPQRQWALVQHALVPWRA